MVSALAKVSAAVVTFLSAPTALPRLMVLTVTPAGAAGGGGAGAGGGGAGTATGLGGSSFLPQAASVTMLAVRITNRVLRFIACSPLYRAEFRPAHFGGILSFWPGKILSGSFRTSLFASKIRFHSLAFPYSRRAIFDRLSPATTS